MRAKSLLLLLFMIIALFPLSCYNGCEEIVIVDQMVISNSRTPHAPILITSNEDFVTQAWPGFGNDTHPYVIEGLEITSEGSCIEIQNVSVHYEIINCSLSGTRNSENGSLTILGWNEFYERVSSFGVISDCDIFNSTRGIRVSANDVVIERNTIWNCSSIDAKISGDRIRVLYNDFNTDGMYSLDWRSSKDSALIGNNIECRPHEDHYDEIRLYGDTNFTISQNVFINSRILGSGEDIHLFENDFLVHDYYALDYSGTNITVERCTFNVNEDDTQEFDIPSGFRSSFLNNSRIIDCSGSNLDFSIGGDSTNVTVSGCSLSNFLFKISGSGYFDIFDNVFADSIEGMSLWTINGTGDIHENTITGCRTGIWLNGENYIIHNNTISNNDWGIVVFKSNNQIYYNIFIGNNHSATESEYDAPIVIWDDSVSIGNYWDRYFTVNDRWPVYIDYDAPVIIAIDPIVLPPGSNVTLNFTATDNTPFSYTVTVDGELFEDDSWDGGSVIIELTSLSTGAHEVEITFTDINGNTASFAVSVILSDQIPMTLILVGASAGIAMLVIIIVIKRR
ncbi:MAG: hypothetical protein E3J86_14210 [Candidatus Thorarchaeota archaeon]|nr:MAG: hypothetical protein E3J86_14210 [Candidatus Thorarchaeota archaeon]